MQRIYELALADHLASNRQMALVTGPRQVGKTTSCRKLGTAYLDWDNQDHQLVIPLIDFGFDLPIGQPLPETQRALNFPVDQLCGNPAELLS